MGVVENKQIVHETFAALTAGDADKFLSYLSDDVRWTVIGTTSFSHTYAGKADILDRLVSRVTAQVDGFIINTILSTIAEGDYVVV